MIEQFLNPEFVDALGWTLLHSLWQGAVFAILLALIFIALRSYTAQSRYIVAAGLLMAFFLTVGATFSIQWQNANSRIELAEGPSEMLSANDNSLLSNNNPAMSAEANWDTALSVEGEKLVADQSHFLQSFSDYYEQHLPLLVTIWLLGVLFLQLRFLGQLAYVQRLKHYGTQLFPDAWSEKIEELEGKLRIQKKVKYLTSLRIESPMVIGWLKPAILVPRHLFKSLSETEIYAVLAHELAHIRREDFVVNLMQTLLCNIFFFHPGVWWMSNRVDEEREHCCDDLAVAVTGEAASYAKTLINVSEFQIKQNAPQLAVAFSGKNKKRERGGFTGRIRRLFLRNNAAGTFREGFATACILLVGLFFGIVATGHTVQAEESELTSELNLTEVESDQKSAEVLNIVASETETTNASEVDEDSEPLESQDAQSDEQFDLEVSSQEVTRIEITVETNSDSQDDAPIDTRIDALVMACAEGDLEFVETLINSGIDINLIGSEGFTPLMMAASENKVDIIEYLLKKGADVNQVSRGWTALIEAADEGSFESMKLLIKAGADINYYVSRNSPTAISMTASEGNLDCMKLLIKYGADPNGIGTSAPPLHFAAEENKKDIIDYLIAQKVNINKRDAAGLTALMYAASEGNKYAVKKLIEAGADITIADLHGSTAKVYAEAEGEYEVSDYLNTEKRPAIHQATLDGLIEKVEDMVNNGVDVNSRDDYGRTPLHIASAQGHNLDMMVLFDLGADLNAQDSQGRTPLMYAAADGKRDATVLLVSRQANVNIRDIDGMSAYAWSKNGGNDDLARFLGLITDKNNRTDNNINNNRNYNQNSNNNKNQQNRNRNKKQEKKNQKEIEKSIQKQVEKNFEVQHEEHSEIDTEGRHIDIFNFEENTANFIDAARNGTVEQCRHLLKNGVKINTSDASGITALMAAAKANRLDNAIFLIENGADVNKAAKSGLTALHFSTIENFDQMAQLLLSNNADVDAKMQYSSTDGSNGNEPIFWKYQGATPLLIAVESGNYQVASVLIKAGANPKQTLSKKEYRMKEGRTTYLSLSEVVGLDNGFLKDSKITVSDYEWTPYKQAILINDAKMLSLFFQ